MTWIDIGRSTVSSTAWAARVLPGCSSTTCSTLTSTTHRFKAFSMKRTQPDPNHENPNAGSSGHASPIRPIAGETVDMPSGAASAQLRRTNRPWSFDTPSPRRVRADDTERPGPVNATLDAPASGGKGGTLDSPSIRSTTPERTLPPGAEIPLSKLPMVAGYEIVGILGEGGMGIVFKARQVRLDRFVALKMIRAGTALALKTSPGSRPKPRPSPRSSTRISSGSLRSASTPTCPTARSNTSRAAPSPS